MNQELTPENVLKSIHVKCQNSNFHNGKSIVSLCEEFEAKYEDVRKILIDLYKQKKVEFKQGVNLKMFYTKKP